ncbi:MAG TPA: DnaJ domain-containing protein, partial [Gammaproteobacteria bacterium]|nr:DnaJ domain-containing protein [Gammaproteobacteria bacterium]
QGPRRTPADDAAAIDEAYRALGVAASASNEEVKTAYRRLMNRHHPDKLVARGLPESMIGVAEQKTHEIRAAYEKIKAKRGFK